jgi:UDP-N-acetylmuramate--alanine ligase
VLSAAREAAQATVGNDETIGRVIAVVQPHRYSRLQALMDDFQNAFNDADIVMVAPVYAAGEEPIEGVDSAVLAEGLRAHGHRMVKTVADPQELARSLRDIAAEGDIIVCMGAGDITKWAAGLAEGIQKARASK